MKTTKEKVLELLEAKNMNYISGQEIADTLFITRAGIWKAVKSLREAGYNIEAVSNRGYRLVPDRDVLSKEEIDHILSSKKVNIDTIVFDEVESTNDCAREFALESQKDRVIVSDYQKKGRGRRGRSFYSPKGTGLYASFLLHPSMDISKATKLTCMAAVAVCKAIETVTDKKPLIKWVNDIFLEDKKICGILTEGYTSIEDGSLSYVIVGIGINLYYPKDGFPDEIKKLAGVLLPDGQSEEGFRNKLMAEIIYQFIDIISTGNDEEIHREYMDRSFLTDHYVKIMQAGIDGSKDYAKVLGIDEDFRLLIRYENGKEDALSTGEVSVVKY